MGGSKVKFPGPSPQEQELQGMQLELLREQRGLLSEQLRVQDLMAPFLYKSAGINPRMEGGKIVGFDEVPDELGGMRKDIEKSFLQRTQKALRGELDLDPALERGIGENRRTLEATLAQQLGPGYATSTPGIQALAEAGKGAEELRSASRRGELSLAEGLGLTREEANAQRNQARIANLAGAFQLPGANQGGGTGYLNSIAQAIGGYAGQRQGMFQANQMNAQQGSPWADLLGTVVGMGIGSFMGPFGASIGGKAGGMLSNRLFG